MKSIRVILNGKGAANPQAREAINRLRDEGQPLEVRCTWEGGDAGRFAQEAMTDGIDDGLLDLMVISNFLTKDFGMVLNELQDFDNPDNRYVHYRQMDSFEIEVPGRLPINLDGEPYRWDRIRFGIKPKALRVVLPEGCPVLLGS